MDSKHQPWKRYDDEFKRNAVELIETSGRPITEVYNPSPQNPTVKGVEDTLGRPFYRNYELSE
ncbi:MAG: hypothetical protein ACR2IE_03580 [Candidatus Sumerlaeaceae bacterium]